MDREEKIALGIGFGGTLLVFAAYTIHRLQTRVADLEIFTAHVGEYIDRDFQRRVDATFGEMTDGIE